MRTPNPVEGRRVLSIAEKALIGTTRAAPQLGQVRRGLI
jgi:hypothetical protein